MKLKKIILREAKYRSIEIWKTVNQLIDFKLKALKPRQLKINDWTNAMPAYKWSRKANYWKEIIQWKIRATVKWPVNYNP